MNPAEERGAEGEGWGSTQAVITAPPTAAPQPLIEREATVVLRKLQPLSVLRVSLVFYFCVMLILVFALAIVYWVLGLINVWSSVSHFLSHLALGGPGGFQINGGWIFVRIFLVGLVSVVVWSLVNVFLVFLYNLVADVVGGIRITISDEP